MQRTFCCMLASCVCNIHVFLVKNKKKRFLRALKSVDCLQTVPSNICSALLAACPLHAFCRKFRIFSSFYACFWYFRHVLNVFWGIFSACFCVLAVFFGCFWLFLGMFIIYCVFFRHFLNVFACLRRFCAVFALILRFLRFFAHFRRKTLWKNHQHGAKTRKQL